MCAQVRRSSQEAAKSGVEYKSGDRHGYLESLKTTFVLLNIMIPVLLAFAFLATSTYATGGFASQCQDFNISIPNYNVRVNALEFVANGTNVTALDVVSITEVDFVGMQG